MKIDPTKNTIICGDNIEWLNWIPDESIDLCYIDPPFFTQRDFKDFDDRFSGGIMHYIEWIEPRLGLIKEKLKKTGAIFLHCDHHASHRLRCLLDDIFKSENFRNEIIWRRTNAHNMSSKTFARSHDIILYFSKSDKFTFKCQFAAYSESQLKRFKTDNKGRLYKAENLTFSTVTKSRQFEWRGTKPPSNRSWGKSREDLEQLWKNGRILAKKDGTPRMDGWIIYLDELKGKPMDTIWDDIVRVGNTSQERLGYPTQKPEALVKRIIECASVEGDIILDCFAGGFTTAKVCADLKRKFICGDVSPVACKIGMKRLNNHNFFDYERL